MHLIACPSCDRQYDVTHLSVGARVHCSCEELLSVPAPPKLGATALICTHCGGPVTADDPQCGYCNARLSENDRRETTVCPACFTRIASDSHHCRSCGTAILPQALQALPEGRACPRCQGALQHRSLVVAQVVECAACHGLWLRPEDFDGMCEGARQRPSGFLPKSPLPAARPVEDAQLLRYIPCLACGELMLRRQFRWGGKGSGVVLDACADHGVWLDDEELAAIVQFLRSDPAAQHNRGGDWKTPRRTLEGVNFHDGSTLDRELPNPITEALGWIADFISTSVFRR